MQQWPANTNRQRISALSVLADEHKRAESASDVLQPAISNKVSVSESLRAHSPRNPSLQASALLNTAEGRAEPGLRQQPEHEAVLGRRDLV